MAVNRIRLGAVFTEFGLCIGRLRVPGGTLPGNLLAAFFAVRPGILLKSGGSEMHFLSVPLLLVKLMLTRETRQDEMPPIN